ncbi:MAG: helix-turn-helix domain-containing protein [Antricoccus sp.]
MKTPPTRQYRSPLREEQANQTRRKIVQTATVLFAENGYSSTSIEAIAQAAGVSRKTVFDSVGSKVQLVKLAYDVAIVGDDEAIPLGDRPQIARLRLEPDAAVMLAGYAALVTTISHRIAGVWRALEDAAASDPKARELHELLVQQRRTAMSEPAKRLVALDALQTGISEREAADLLWLFNDPSLYDKLVRQRGWSDTRFQDWLTAELLANLLGT